MKKTIIGCFFLVGLLSFVSKQDRLQATGKITLLRVHDINTRYGPAGDNINAEVIIQLDSKPDNAFGFQLRSDGNGPAREGMLSLLRDAFANNWNVTIDYDINPGKKNGILVRVWVKK